MPTHHHQVLIIGGGAAGIAAASSLLKRRPTLDIAIIEPSDTHLYQPGLTLVGAGVFPAQQTSRPMQDVMPRRVTWIKQAAEEFAPDDNYVLLDNANRVSYDLLIVAPGLILDWAAVDGLTETLGANGVTSNYAADCAPYTWQLVENLAGGRAVFTQPPMPIKCAGAPQKAVYLSCNHWEKNKRLKDIEVSFHNAGGVLFGVPDYVPALENYMTRYNVNQQINQRLVAVDGAAKTAWFETGSDDKRLEVPFDMLHVSPPQRAPDFIAQSALANDAGWVDVNQTTLQHTSFDNIYSLGDVCSAPNAKTAAAVRKQAPVTAMNALSTLDGATPTAAYDGYGSCPLTVERGKVVLAEFGFGGKLLPTAPSWLLDGKRATRLGWFLKTVLLPPIYFGLMLKGHEWLAQPQTI